MTICFTSLTCAYLSRGRLLAASVRRHHPDWAIWAVLVDVPPPGMDLRAAVAGFDRVLDARALIAGSFGRWVFGHDVVAACCAVKGAALCRLLGLGVDRVVYLDPDTVLFAPLPDMDGATVQLTPHRLRPGADTAAGRAAAREVFEHGIYNLGYLAVSSAAEGWAFARWWAELLAEACADDPARGLFVDQRYCDTVPALFPGAQVLRDPGCNVATWNLDQRPLTLDGAGAIVTHQGEVEGPLRLFHFSKHGGVGDRAIRLHAAANPVALELWCWYGRAIAAARDVAPAWRWAAYCDGALVTQAARAAWRTRPDLRGAFADPFSTGPGTFREWFDASHPEQSGAGDAAPRA